ncbi:hypothetical protein SNE40_014104 [Patella caerulea]|uniref:Short-chain dehydrogenase/reductase 3 n=1 Tax=Patella caerulea TaxID=87958 RepID=A0AAN8JGC9_PATCE
MIKCLLDFSLFFYTLFRIIVRSAFFFVLPKTVKDIGDDVIVITGGGKGIGKAIALQFAKYHPSHIVLWGRTEANLQSTAKHVRECGVKCTPMVCDVSQKDMIYKCAKDIQSTIGEVSILVNNAGVVYGQSILESSEENIENTFQVNTLSHFWTMKSFLPGMMNKNRGHIVEISSVLGLMGLRDAADYCSSKFAVTGLTESLYDELGCIPNNNIHITSIHPYMVANDMFSGLRTRLSWLIPPLAEEYVAKRTVEGVLTNRNKVILPRAMYLIILITSLMPIKVQQLMVKLTGADQAMANFHGNQR